MTKNIYSGLTKAGAREWKNEVSHKEQIDEAFGYAELIAQEILDNKWVDCEMCKHHHYAHGHLWTCSNQKASVTLDLQTGLVVCPYHIKKEE